MIHRSAAALARLWAASGVINSGDTEAYQYGLELIMSTLLNIALMLGLSAAMGHVWLLIPYLAAFIPLRLSAGGYHAKQHLACILFNGAVYFAALLIVNALSSREASPFCLLACVVSAAVTFLFAPVPARNKPLSPAERRRNRAVSLSLSLLFLVLCMAFYFTGLLSLAGCKIFFCGQAAAAMLLLMEKASFPQRRSAGKE